MPEEALTGFFGIHSEKNGCPMMRGWAKSEAEANAMLEKIKASDAEPEDEYWIMEMTEPELETHRAVGLIPEEVR